MPPHPTNDHPSESGRPRDPPLPKWNVEEAIAETQALRPVSQDAPVRPARRLAALKHQRRQNRLASGALAAPRQLQPPDR